MPITKYFRNFCILKLFLIIFALTLLQPFHIVNASPPNIYGHSSFFRSYSNFFVNSLSSSSPSLSFAARTPLINQNIIRCGISLGEFTKSNAVQFSFTASITYASPTTDNFTITIGQLLPFPINVRLFIIVIMDQGSTPMIDLTTHSLGSTNPISSLLNSQQVYTYNINVSTDTIFSDTTNIQVFAVLTCFNIALNTSFYFTKPFIVDVGSIITGPTSASSTYHIGSDMALSSASMVNIFYNSTAIPTTTLNGNSFYYSLYYWEFNSTVSVNMMNYPAWGPNFDYKCFIGIYYSQYMYVNTINHILSFDAFTNYYRFDSTGSDKTLLMFFCFGYGYQCGQTQKYLDVYNNQCYTITTCPITPSGDYITQYICPKCFYQNCQQCSHLNRSICVSCDNSTHRQIVSNNCTCMTGYIEDMNSSIMTCRIDCSYYLQGCDPYSCNSVTNCTMCQSSNSYYITYNSSTTISSCKPCNQTLSNCSNCISATVCTVCQNGTYLLINNCFDCRTGSVLDCFDCQDIAGTVTCYTCYDGYYLLNNTCYICSSITLNCSSCDINTTGSPFCSVCDNGYYLNSTVCDSCSQAMTYCLECSNSTYCDVCAAPFTFDASHSCFNCTVGSYVTGTCNKVSGCSNSVLINGAAVCINCDTSLGFQFNQTLKNCVCQTGFKTINNTCLQICGDNLVINMQCDDGNLINGDGCNKLCLKQPGYTCEITSSGGSNCFLVQDFSIKLNYIQRVMGENAALLSFTVTPASTKLQYIDWKSVVTFNFTNSVSVSYSYSNGQLLVKVDYNSSINDQNIVMNINFDPNSIVSSPSSLSFKMVAINGPLTYENNLSDFKNLNILSLVIIGFALLQFLISTYLHKMIGLETLQCIQTIYFVRMTITDSYGSSSIYGLNGLNYSNGFSYSSENTNDLSVIPIYFTKLGLSLKFLDNVNIMIIPIILAGTIYLVYKVRMLYIKHKFIQSSDKKCKDQYTILKRTSDWFYEHYVFTFSILLMFTVSFSTVEQILSKSSSQQTMSTSTSFVANILILMLIVLVSCISVIEGINKHFKSNTTSKNQLQKNLDYDQNSIVSFSELYIPIYLFYYFALTLLTLSITADFLYVSESELALTIVYTIMLCVWRPYVFKVHNFGIIFNQFTVVFFIFTTVLPSYFSISQSGYSLMQYSAVCMLMMVIIIAYVRTFIEWKTQREESQYKNKRSSNIRDESYYKQKRDALLYNPSLYNNTNILSLIKQNTLLKIDNPIKNKYMNELQFYQQKLQNEQTFEPINNQYLSLSKIKERLRKQHKELSLQKYQE